MGELTRKSELFKSKGYAYNFDRMMYVNRRSKKAFSVEFVEDHTEEELRRYIAEECGTGGYFFLNTTSSESMKRELESALN